MDSRIFSVLNRLSSIRQSKQRFPESLIPKVPISNRTYCTSRSGKISLYGKISPLGDPNTSVIPELNNWVQNGNKVRMAELQRIINDLSKRKRFSQALEVSEWMNKKGICVFSSTEHAVQLDLIGRVRGFLSAERYFNNLQNYDQTVKTYGALLNCYVQQRQTDKSLSHLQKMKEMGFASSPLIYNDIMCLYINVGQYKKVPDVLAEMKQNNVYPDNLSYRTCINSYGAVSDIQGVEKVLKEMERQPHIAMDWNTYAVAANFYIKAGLLDKAIEALKKSEERLDKRDGLGYNHLISLYASMGNKAGVLRLWGLEKSACKKLINRDYITMLESLVKLGELEEAEKVLKEWESSSNGYDFQLPNIVIVGYSEKGLIEKAQALLEELMEKGKLTTPNSWVTVAAGYMDKGKMEKAVDCMKGALSLHVNNKGWKPNGKVIRGILSWLGDNGHLEEVEAFVESLRPVIPMNRQMYHCLIKANIRAGKEVDELLARMKADNIVEDAETKKILGISKKKIYVPCSLILNFY